MKTQSEVKESGIFTEAEHSIFDAVIEQIGDYWSEIWENPEDYSYPQGGVHGFFEYNQTEPFARDNIDDILEMLSDEQSATGTPLMPPGDYNRLNWLAWFALSTIMNKIMSIKEEENN